MRTLSESKSEPVDVALLLEGTYPYVSGGVSSWVHAIISGMPDLTFALVFMGANYGKKEPKFPLPPNVRSLVEWGVYDYLPQSLPPLPGLSRGAPREALAAVRRLCLELQEGRTDSFDAVFEVLSRRSLSMGDLAYGPKAWWLLQEVYQERAREISFLDFFWTWRYALLPVLNLFYAAVPRARLYHAICTGWAGILGVIAKKRFSAPLILTEHGIYVNERRIEISQSEWIYTQEEDSLTVRRELGFFKDLWINLFEATAKLCYQRCDAIFTLYEGNRRMQVEFGAAPSIIEIIPNGVEAGAAGPAAPAREAPAGPLRVGFVGRVVPIKDVKTLIRACRLVLDGLPETEIFLMGPTEEDKKYFAECQELAGMLGMGERIKFLGRVKVAEYYPTLAVQVLTSISEGQPLVMLEGYLCGVPVVATAVGACREMIEGLTPEDRELGPSGIVTRVGNPEETGRAILRLLRDPELRKRMGEAGRRRVHGFYDYHKMIARYRQVYKTYQRSPAQEPDGGNRL